MAWIVLENINVRGPVGFYEEERALKMEFRVSVKIKTKISNPGSDKIEDTLNYEIVYNSIIEKFSKGYKLIEKVIYEIYKDLVKKVKRIETVVIKVEKKRPFLDRKEGSSIIEMTFPDDLQKN